MFYVVYYKDTKKVYSVSVNCDEDALRNAIPETQDFIVVDELPEYDSLRQYSIVDNGQVVVVDKDLTAPQEQEIVNMLAKQEIESLKFELRETDYYTLKYMEGALSEEVFNEKCEYRQSLRNKIKELEGKIVNQGVDENAVKEGEIEESV